jgi:hypothetical protein
VTGSLRQRPPAASQATRIPIRLPIKWSSRTPRNPANCPFSRDNPAECQRSQASPLFLDRPASLDSPGSLANLAFLDSPDSPDFPASQCSSPRIPTSSRQIRRSRSNFRGNSRSNIRDSRNLGCLEQGRPESHLQAIKQP